MNISIEIKHFSLIDYNVLLKVVSEYVKQYQISRDKFECEKDMFDLTDTLYALQCHKHAVNIEIDNHWKSFLLLHKLFPNVSRLCFVADK